MSTRILLPARRRTSPARQDALPSSPRLWQETASTEWTLLSALLLCMRGCCRMSQAGRCALSCRRVSAPVLGERAHGKAAQSGTLRHGIASAPLMEATRTFFMEPITEPRGRFVLSTVAGAPAAPLDKGCGNADSSPPTAAQLDGPSALAAVPAGGALALHLFVADARGHAIWGLSAACAALCQNGGACLAADQCTCTYGWSGADCTRPLCESGCGARRL
jgi:hypothetical protein